MCCGVRERESVCVCERESSCSCHAETLSVQQTLLDKSQTVLDRGREESL